MPSEIAREHYGIHSLFFSSMFSSELLAEFSQIFFYFGISKVSQGVSLGIFLGIIAGIHPGIASEISLGIVLESVKKIKNFL